VGSLKIGLIAQERRPHLTNDVARDPRVSDPEWAEREGMVAFAGYPLLVQERLVGVLGLFSRHSLGQDALGALESVATSIAILIERKRAEALLQDRERQFHTLAETIPHLAWMADETGHIFWYNKRWYEYTGTTFDEMKGLGLAKSA
jgi:GAF domain-containing protein